MSMSAAAASVEAVRTVVLAPGVAAGDVPYELTELRDRQEAQLLARQRTEMALQRATRVATPPPDDSTGLPPRIDVSALPTLVEWPEVGPFGEQQTAATDAAPSGEFRPVLTELRAEGGLGAENLSDGTHLFGRRSYAGDDLIRFSVGATSHFKLEAQDVPGSATGRWRSAPPADAHGTIFGLTGNYLPVLFADDKWCHCFRFLRHSLWQHVNNQWRSLGERKDVATLIHLENVVQVGEKTVELSGWMPSPVIEFGILDRNAPIWAQVEVRFDIDLEGDALIMFSPEHNPANSVVVRACGWWARPI
jgi:hypothetical protein